MDDNLEVEEWFVHLDNKQLKIFTNPLPKITQQPKGFIGSVSASYCMNYYLPNRR